MRSNPLSTMPVMHCPLCSEYTCRLWDTMARHVLKYHRRHRVGNMVLNNLRNVTVSGQTGFICWCGTEVYVYIPSDGNAEFAKHLEEAGGLDACLLKAALNLSK